MSRSFSRFGLRLAIAVIAAAIADPIVEFASNAGCFGHGAFTDHSNLDVVPALIAGLTMLVAYFSGKARAIVAAGALPPGVARVLPSIFVLQISTLCIMETAEQLIAWGHLFGPTVWLGAPLQFSLTIHAVLCLAVTVAIARSGRTLAATALRVIRLIAAIATRAARALPRVPRGPGGAGFKELWVVLGAVRERAPPVLVS
ncbi:MAG: hypothetical protein JO104_07495 [Candidatus Eremiobacteraeota bacterium]|nr:hypothetical protein [Candidatus Eremiobacteraeota bacterium]